MTLALVFLFGVFAVPSPPVGVAVYSSGQPASLQDAQTPGGSPQSTPGTTPAAHAANPPQAPSAKTSASKTSSKRSPTKKKTDACKTPAARRGGASKPSSAGGQPTDAATAAKACPPPKIVVRQGGTSEPSIQLAGGSTGIQATQAKDNVTQMLDSTEVNLKKLSERQLNSTEQDTVAQIRQFIEQSKTSSAAGDTERARTLAWKAQTLSEDLVNPKR